MRYYCTITIRYKDQAGEESSEVSVRELDCPKIKAGWSFHPPTLWGLSLLHKEANSGLCQQMVSTTDLAQTDHC